MNYTIKLTENQLRAVQRALETWERMMMGQFVDFANDLSLNDYVYDKNDPQNDEKFAAYIERRDMCQNLMERAHRIACPNPQNKTEDMMIVEDIWTAVRYQQWKDREEPKSHDTVDSRKPLKISDEPIPEIVRIENV